MENHDDDHAQAMAETGYWGRQGAGLLFIARDTGRWLFPHRSPFVLEPNTWGVWGGAVDGDEDPRVAACREAEEECGYMADPETLIHLYTYEDGDFRYFNYAAVVDHEFEPHLNWESQGYRWVKFGEWPEPLHPGTAEMINTEPPWRISDGGVNPHKNPLFAAHTSSAYKTYTVECPRCGHEHQEKLSRRVVDHGGGFRSGPTVGSTTRCPECNLFWEYGVQEGLGGFTHIVNKPMHGHPWDDEEAS